MSFALAYSNWSGSRSDPGARPPARGIAQIDGVLYVNGTPIADPTPGGAKDQRTKPEETPLVVPSLNPPDIANVTVRENIAWGDPECPKRGVKCFIPFMGTIYLATETKGKILLLAREKGREQPAEVRELATIERGRTLVCVTRGLGCDIDDAWLRYTAGFGAEYVVFEVRLVGMDGKVLARRQSDFYPVSP